MKEQKIFEISWGDYDDYKYFIFTHDNKTQQEFKKDIKFIFRKYGKEFLDSKQKLFVGPNSWLDYIVPKMEELGYKEADIIRESLSGSSIFDKGNLSFSKLIGKELTELANTHNIRIENKLDGLL